MTVPLRHPDVFADRHIGPREQDAQAMLRELGVGSMQALIDETVAKPILMPRPLKLPPARNEAELLEEALALSRRNQVFKSYIGMGYYDTFTPSVILRNVLQNPGWYTQYTPYQAEISQGRLEALLNYQTMVADLTGMEIANASMLDEATAAAEALAMLHRVQKKPVDGFFVSATCHPQTIEVVKTRACPLGIQVTVGDHHNFDFQAKPVCAILLQYPATDGALFDYRAFCQRAHAAGALVAVATDLLALALLTPPGEFGADAAVGSSQRFGVPMAYGGPHAAFLATRLAHARSLPGRLIGVAEDAQGKPALRMALQTREQHIRREKATSNICTAQVLLAVMAAMYAVWHGPKGLQAIAERVHALASMLARGLAKLGFPTRHAIFFDTLRVETGPEEAKAIHQRAREGRMNFRAIDEGAIGISLDETTNPSDVDAILAVFAGGRAPGFTCEDLALEPVRRLPEPFSRKSGFLAHPIFHRYRCETEMQRYLRVLQSRDLSLCDSMIPLGSCTMKLNAAAEMIPVTYPGFARIHPFVPRDQAAGYAVMFEKLELWLAEITGFAAVSLQPNAGSQGEYAGLLVIRKYHESRGQGRRDIVLIPSSAHGTNPASAAMAGYGVVVVNCDSQGNIEVADLATKAKKYQDRAAALMVTYPSTHGVFEETIMQVCAIVHDAGAQVYMDGANMNAQVGICRPADVGADVCHLNLHKTFAIPHGGGGPGMGPIGVARHLAGFLPGHPVVPVGGRAAIGPVSAAPWGSAGVLTISWAYIAMMGAEGLTRATRTAILSANYIAHKLDKHFPVLYKGKNGRVAHECILDARQFKKSAGIEVEDIAKRLMDYGFHAPTISFPVPGTLMVEPTESEPKEELDRFIEAMTLIREEIREIETGKAPREGNLLKNAPHTAEVLTATEWTRPYPRERAAFPTAHTRRHKFWPSVGRLNAVLGDRNLMCTCPPLAEYREAPAVGAAKSLG